MEKEAELTLSGADGSFVVDGLNCVLRCGPVLLRQLSFLTSLRDFPTYTTPFKVRGLVTAVASGFTQISN